MTATDWLKAICADDGPEWMARPSCLLFNGVSYVMATNGKMAVVIEGDGLGLPEVSEKMAGILEMSGFEQRLTTTAEELAAWCGDYEKPIEQPHGCCGGDGKCECNNCDVQHDCGACEGTGTQLQTVMRYGVLAGTGVDRNRLALAMPNVSGPCAVSIRPGSTVIVRIDGNGWIVLAATYTPKDAKGPEFPAKETL